MKQIAVFPGRYIQVEGALGLLVEEIERLGTSALVIAGGTAAKTIVPEYLPAWRERAAVTVERFGGECCDEEIERLVAAARSQNCDVIVGIGGGKVIDAAKEVGRAVGGRVAIAPTIASTDAPTSAVAVVYTSSGVFVRCDVMPRNPDLVLVDTRLIAQAPVRYLVAGMGDALATWFEGESCRAAHAPNECGGAGTLAGYALARLCYDTLLEYGLAARIACEEKVVTPALSHIVEANTLLSGLGFESAGLASAHSIHNGLTQLEATHAYLHGEKVAIGTLAGLFLADQSRETIDQVYDFCESVGLPTTLADIGLAGASQADLRRVAEAACAERETIHHEPGPVSPDAVVAALKTADRFGRERADAAG
ncbi:MAG: glycerol dehydrogenase [Thermoguttaceae bacterium]